MFKCQIAQIGEQVEHFARRITIIDEYVSFVQNMKMKILKDFKIIYLNGLIITMKFLFASID